MIATGVKKGVIITKCKTKAPKFSLEAEIPSLGAQNKFTFNYPRNAGRAHPFPCPSAHPEVQE